MMKILQIYKSYYPETIGGVERLIDTLAMSLQKSGVESALLTTTIQKNPYEKNIGNQKVYYFPQNFNIASCPMSFSLFTDFKDFTKKFDILHFHFPWPFADLLSFLAPSSQPMVVTYHSDIVKQKILKVFYKPLMSAFFRRVDKIAVTSENLLNSSDILSKYKDKASVIPIGAEKESYPEPSEQKINFWKQKLANWGNIENRFFLFVGVLRYYKGLDYLLQAIESTSIPVIIAGKGPEEEKLKKYAEERNIQNVHFVGFISEKDKVALLKLCCAVVSPSHLKAEAFCISLLEGLMFGKPLISTDLGTGTSFVNKHHFTGLVVSPGNPKTLQDAMMLLSSDAAIYSRLAKNAKVYYEEYFTGKKMAEEYMKIYQELLKK